MLAGAPAAAAAALAGGTVADAVAIGMAKAAEIDPIFEAIERERAAYAAYCVFDEARSQIGEKPPKGRHKAYQAWYTRFLEAEREHDKIYGAMCDARSDFLLTQPTSVAGLRAFIDRIDGPFSSGDTGEALWDEVEKEVAFPTLSAAARKLIGGGTA